MKHMKNSSTSWPVPSKKPADSQLSEAALGHQLCLFVGDIVLIFSNVIRRKISTYSEWFIEVCQHAILRRRLRQLSTCSFNCCLVIWCDLAMSVPTVKYISMVMSCGWNRSWKTVADMIEWLTFSSMSLSVWISTSRFITVLFFMHFVSDRSVIRPMLIESRLILAWVCIRV